MQKSKIERLIELLKSALLQTKAEFSDSDLEKMAVVVYDLMSNPGRNFHTVHHIFDVATGLDGISTLAAIFHDTIYYQVDRSFHPSIEALMFECVKVENEQFTILAPKNNLIGELHIIFGLKAGDTLKVIIGLNEFLSAVVAVTLLSPILPHLQLLKVAALIESSIPFRKDPITQLIERVSLINFPKNEIEDLAKRAVDFSNSDVFNFADDDSKKFLNNTWNLISETNYSLRREGDNYTILDYRVALLKTYLFFKSLDQVNIFNRYNNYPTPTAWEKLTTGSARNIEIGRKYLSVQLVSIAAIEALAEITGGNIPMCLMLGEVRRRDQKILRMEDFIGPVENPKPDLNKHLIALLEEGRSQESSFDMKASPVGFFIYKNLGENQSEKLFEIVLNYFDKKITPQELLNHYPKDVINKLIFACSKISSTRRERLTALVQII
jgi:hypothetical protein